MSPKYLQDFVNKTRQYKTSFFCLAASCCYLLAGQPQNAVAAPRDQETPKRRPIDANQLARVNEMFSNCDKTKSLFDRMLAKRNTEYTPFKPVDTNALLVGSDNCPGTNVPAGSSFIDAGTTVGANNTVNLINACIPFPQMNGPDMVYKMVLQAPATRPSCTITVTPQAGYDTGVYLLSQGGGGCPPGPAASMTNCVTGKDAGLVGVAEQITTAQMNLVPAGIYYLFVDSFYCGSDLSGCGPNECATANPNCQRGTYTLNISNCATTAPTAAIVGVGGRVTTANGRGIAKAAVTVTLPSGQSRTVMTNPFGFYNFEDIEVGGSYVFQVNSKGYTFSNSSQLVTVNDSIQDLNFVADAQGRSK